MPGKVATLATCSGPWSFLICSISLSSAKMMPSTPHVRAVTLGNPPLTRAGRLERSAISFRLAHCVLREHPDSIRDDKSVTLPIIPLSGHRSLGSGSRTATMGNSGQRFPSCGRRAR